LEVSYTGYATQRIDNISFGRELLIEMEMGVQLDDVIIMGYMIPAPKQQHVPELLEPKPISKAPIHEIQTQKENTKKHYLFPNPFQYQINIQFKAPKRTTYLVNLYDIHGALHFAQAFELKKGKQQLTISDLPENLQDGTYIVQVVQGRDVILTEKVVKASE
ncbi:MAG: T9SS type A sorting domain-containing protein, partial [Bacteroidota bacterium]